MFVQSNETTRIKHKNGLALQQRLGGKETLVQWSNGDQRWCRTNSLEGKIVLVGSPEYADDE